MPDLKERDDVVSQRWPVKGALSRTSGPVTEPFLEMETKSTQLPWLNNSQQNQTETQKIHNDTADSSNGYNSIPPLKLKTPQNGRSLAR